MLVGPVGPRVEVGAAGQAESVEPVEQPVDGTGPHRCQDHRQAAGLADGVEVALTERELGTRRLALGQGRVIVARRTSEVDTPMIGSRLTAAPRCP